MSSPPPTTVYDPDVVEDYQRFIKYANMESCRDIWDRTAGMENQ